ncbi:hypothetical protein ING2D1G_0719 [Peptoniphilus sp. ING2-D1G]|nr:hypothetical protein ING2D1G_0719 [Peptoniphilus sp. ING2-D1G]
MYHNQDELYYKAWRRLPERFRKPNNLDLYYVLYGGYGELEKGFASINDSRNIDKAQGETLDKLGANVGQFRFGEDDDLYRQLIKVRIIANLSIGSIPVINKVLSILVKDVYLGLEEAYLIDEWDNEPAAFRLILNKYAGKLPYEIIDRIKAAGVRVLFELRYRESVILKEKTNTYTNRLYPVSTYHQCGSIYNHQYVGKKINSNIKLPNGTRNRSNRKVFVGERKAGAR